MGQMKSDLSANRSKLADLVYQMRKFTESELRSEFHRRHGKRPIDGRQSLRKYLRELVQLGILEYENGVYSIVSSGGEEQDE